MTPLSGHCLCGAICFELQGPSNWVGHCHCESCRRATASPITTFIGHPDGQWRWSGEGTPVTYQSAPGVTRSFCGTCGSPITYATASIPGETHFYAALLEDPNAVTPTVHWHYDEHLDWPHIVDELTKRPQG
ncbi:GFA family protein [Phaeobacter marinintestinus]|uniref:GFA family protein n=1 Tax=Falsiphaeobacter marinintestinus TaxID=1492905 RepID=UPI0016460B3D|nr:GFA family protein [Phaeobacter marinintestinus]